MMTVNLVKPRAANVAALVAELVEAAESIGFDAGNSIEVLADELGALRDAYRERHPLPPVDVERRVGARHPMHRRRNAG